MSDRYRNKTKWSWLNCTPGISQERAPVFSFNMSDGRGWDFPFAENLNFPIMEPKRRGCPKAASSYILGGKLNEITTYGIYFFPWQNKFRRKWVSNSALTVLVDMRLFQSTIPRGGCCSGLIIYSGI